MIQLMLKFQAIASLYALDTFAESRPESTRGFR
jgi:hypothetical protein